MVKFLDNVGVSKTFLITTVNPEAIGDKLINYCVEIKTFFL